MAWDRGQASLVDLSDMISKGGVFAELSDQATFSAVRVGENDRVVEWPEPRDESGNPVIGIDADALFEKAKSQRMESLAVGVVKLVSPPRVRSKAATTV